MGADPLSQWNAGFAAHFGPSRATSYTRAIRAFTSFLPGAKRHGVFAASDSW
jgi:hypothetical protein